jgi:hypothetical protein
VSAKAAQRGDQVSANALGREAGVAVGGRVLRPGAAVRAHGHARHAFDAAGDDQVFPAAGDFLRAQVDGLQARGAKAVDLHARDAEVPARLEQRRFGQHRALVANGGDAAHHHVVDLGRVKAVALAQLLKQAAEQIDGFDFVQAAVFFAFATGRAHRVKDERMGHGHLLNGPGSTGETGD